MIDEQDLRMDRLHQVPGGNSCLHGGGGSLAEGVVEGGAAIRQVGIDLERKNTKILLKQELYLMNAGVYFILDFFIATLLYLFVNGLGGGDRHGRVWREALEDGMRQNWQVLMHV